MYFRFLYASTSPKVFPFPNIAILASFIGCWLNFDRMFSFMFNLVSTKLLKRAEMFISKLDPVYLALEEIPSGALSSDSSSILSLFFDLIIFYDILLSLMPTMPLYWLKYTFFKSVLTTSTSPLVTI